MDFDAFMDSAWNDHADAPDAVAERLVAAARDVAAAAHVLPLARLATHVFGEHLGQWQRGVDLLAVLRGATVSAGDVEIVATLARMTATLHYAAGDAGALDGLKNEDRIAALAGAAAALAGRSRFKDAIAAFDTAVAAAERGLPTGSPAIRAMAVCGNNLAAALEEKTDRDATETRAMVSAARAGLRYWRLAGTWLEEERAYYRLARSLLQAGDARAAIEAAGQCVAICAANDAPAFERVFAQAALAMAQRAAGDREAFAAARSAALDCLNDVPQSERHWCEADLKAIEAF